MAAAEADGRLLSPGNKELMSCSALPGSPVSILDLDSFEDCKTAATTSSTTTCSFDISAAVVIPPLETRLAPLHELDPTAVKSFDDLVALNGIYGYDAVYEWIGSLAHSNDDETVGAEPKALITPAKEQDEDTTGSARDQIFMKVRSIILAIPSRSELEQIPEPDERPITFNVEEQSFCIGFKSDYQTPSRDPTDRDNCTLLRLRLSKTDDGDDGSVDSELKDSYYDSDDDWADDQYFLDHAFLCALTHLPHPGHTGPSLYMNVLFITGAHLDKPLKLEEGILRCAVRKFMGLSFKQQKFMEEVGLGNDFDGGLLDTRATGYVLWFELRAIDDIISGLRITGHRMGAEYLENWKEGRRGDSEERVERALREENMAAFRKIVDLVLRLDPDKKPPTISLDDSFLWLLDRRYLGRWWESCRDDLGLDDRAVYMPEGDIKKKSSGGRGQKRGYARRHGRPPDPITPAPSAPPSRTPPPATTTLCPPEADEGVASPADVLKGLPRNLFVAMSGLSATGNASPPTAKSGLPKSSEFSAPNPACPSS